MTPTATYIAEENCLQEISQMEKPPIAANKYEQNSTEYFACKIRWDAYNAHLATLRKIPCDISCKGLWQDQQNVVEGKDYEVKMDCKYPVSCFVEETCNCVYTAFPLVPVKSEDERTGIFSVQRLTNGSGHSNLTIITEEAIPDVYIGSLLLVPFVHGYKDPEKVKVLLDENGNPVVTKLRTCIVVEYIFA